MTRTSDSTGRRPKETAKHPVNEALRTLRSDLIRRLLAAAAIIVAAAVLGALALSGVYREGARTAAIDELNPLRASMQRILAQDIQLIRGMMGYVRARPDLSQTEFELIAKDVLQGAADHVRNIALARDLVISHIHPVAGNGQALGLDYRSTPGQWEAVRRVVEDGEIVLAGPLALRQGGLGLIARFPVFHRAPEGKTSALWGIASTVIDFERFLEQAGYHQMERDYRLALVGRNGDVSDGGVFWGDETIRAADPVALDVLLGPGGQWRLLAAPRSGWPTALAMSLWFLAAGAALYGVLALWLALRYRLAKERQRANQVLLEALEQAQAASAAKSSFMAMMSHELRTPLNAIIGFSELLENTPRSNPIWDRAEQYIADIRQSGQFLLAIINDILDLSRIESGRFEVRPELFDAIRAIDVSAKRLGGDLGEKSMTLDLPEASTEQPVFADRRAFFQIITNLLSNAVKYAGTGTRVAISVAPLGDDQVEIVVADDGVGVEQAKLGEILEPFVQVSSSYARSAGGTGLGLAICRSLATAMSGSFEIESDVGQGFRARLLLPSREPDEPRG